MTTDQVQLTERQRALLDALATTNSFDQVPTLHFWVRDYNDNKDNWEDELALATDMAALIRKFCVVAVPGNAYPRYLTTPLGWVALGDNPNATMYDLWHDLLGYSATSVVTGA